MDDPNRHPSWDDLRYVMAVARAGSVLAAARALAVDKATVGRHVAQAEAMLGVRLFDRRPRGFVPTEAGRSAIAAAERMASTVGGLVADLGGDASGVRVSVRVTAPVWFATRVLLPALPELTARHPQLDVVVGGTTRVVSLAQREAEVAIRNVRPDQASMASRRAGELGSTLYAGRRWAKAHRMPESRAALADLPVIGYESAISFLPAFGWLAEGRRHVPLRVNDTLALAAGIRAGVGLGVLPCIVGDEDPGLVRVPFAGVEREVIWLATPAELRKTKAVRTVMAFIAELFAREQAALSP